MNEKTNILHIVGTPGLGGVQTYLLDVSQFDKRYKIIRSLLCLHGDTGDLKEKFLESNVKCISCTIFPKDYMLRPYRLWKIIRTYIPFFFIIKLASMGG